MTKPWTHKHPYPTNPFQRVCGKELEKLQRQMQKQKPKPIYEDALI
jgi:hypothetical protein